MDGKNRNSHHIMDMENTWPYPLVDLASELTTFYEANQTDVMPIPPRPLIDPQPDCAEPSSLYAEIEDNAGQETLFYGINENCKSGTEMPLVAAMPDLNQDLETVMMDDSAKDLDLLDGCFESDPNIDWVWEPNASLNKLSSMNGVTTLPSALLNLQPLIPGSNPSPPGIKATISGHGTERKKEVDRRYRSSINGNISELKILACPSPDKNKKVTKAEVIRSAIDTILRQRESIARLKKKYKALKKNKKCPNCHRENLEEHNTGPGVESYSEVRANSIRQDVDSRYNNASTNALLSSAQM